MLDAASEIEAEQKDGSRQKRLDRFGVNIKNSNCRSVYPLDPPLWVLAEQLHTPSSVSQQELHIDPRMSRDIKAGTTGQQRSTGTGSGSSIRSSLISPVTLVLGAVLGLTSIVLAATMRLPAFKYLVPFLPLALGNNDGAGYTGLPGAGLDGSNDGTKEYKLSAEGIEATFIGYGARLTHLYVNDRQGNSRDIVVGYDDPAEYVAETKPSYFGPVVG